MKKLSIRACMQIRSIGSTASNYLDLKNKQGKTKTREVKLWKHIHRSLVVDVDGNRDALGAGLESVERSLLVGNDERNIGGA